MEGPLESSCYLTFGLLRPKRREAILACEFIYMYVCVCVCEKTRADQTLSWPFLEMALKIYISSTIL